MDRIRNDPFASQRDRLHILPFFHVPAHQLALNAQGIRLGRPLHRLCQREGRVCCGQLIGDEGQRPGPLRQLALRRGQGSLQPGRGGHQFEGARQPERFRDSLDGRGRAAQQSCHPLRLHVSLGCGQMQGRRFAVT